MRDEFYTCLKDIEEELNNQEYKKFFKNKIIFCNCDDSKSNFYHFFKKNFLDWEIKEVIFCSIDSKKYITFINKDNELLEIKNPIINGSFLSDESISLLKRCDVVVTNPPFSLFKDFVALLYKYNKKFLVIGPNNAISYRNIFNLIKDNQLWFGFNFNKTLYFEVPKNYDKVIEINNKYYCKVHQISWFTNIPIKKENKKEYKKYVEIKNKINKYHNYEAIDINDCHNIPIDYKGIMGVPITFLGVYDSNIFNIIGLGYGEEAKKIGIKKIGNDFLSLYKSQGNKGNYVANNVILCYIDKQGKAKIPYARILIKNKFNKNDNTRN